ncbi:MAG: family 1 glycosylhydrolase [Candidatus Jordarchaeum sp.]|uniref:family 1 glycosylhydrolase n=1 Tax=Candidatus Jordarchaeum sp. TaxID=2823881 RepID=UPI00404B2CF7
MSKDDLYYFPKGFLWGSCICDYQAFGGAECDLPLRWTARHIEHYKEDFQLVLKMYHNAWRTSIEWARIEPKEGQINKDALKFYHEYFSELRKIGVKTWVTFHHFTNPRWIHDHQGWLSQHVVKKFVEYVELGIKEFGDYIDYAVVINEPQIYALNAYLGALSPDSAFQPFHNDMGEALTCISNMTQAINESFDVIHASSKNTKVGISNYCGVYVPLDPKNEAHKASADLANQVLNYQVLDGIKDKMDYCGIDYYFKFFMKEDNNVADQIVYPEGLRIIPADLYKRYRKPVAIIENGFPTRDHDEKIKFMLEHLKAYYDAIKLDKVEAIGYNWWCTLHSYEWGYDYKPFFTLIDVEGEEKDVGGYIDLVGSLKRKITPAGEFYGKICKNNGFLSKDYEKYHKMKKPFKNWQVFGEEKKA